MLNKFLFLFENSNLHFRKYIYCTFYFTRWWTLKYYSRMDQRYCEARSSITESGLTYTTKKLFDVGYGNQMPSFSSGKDLSRQIWDSGVNFMVVSIYTHGTNYSYRSRRSQLVLRSKYLHLCIAWISSPFSIQEKIVDLFKDS